MKEAIVPGAVAARGENGHPLPRRDFLKTLAGGIVFLVAWREPLSGAEAEAPVPRGGRPGVPTDFNAFLRIGTDGRITCLTGKIEMGQGPITSLPQMLAEELEVSCDVVDIVMGDTDLCPWDAGTWGSLTTRQFGPLLRAAGAEARGVLLELAGEQLGVAVEQLVLRDATIRVRGDESRRVTYAELAQGRPLTRHLNVRPNLKDVSQFRVMGKSVPRRDAREKVTGQARFTADVRLPGMLYASILRPPAHGAQRVAVDTAAARAIPGVQVVELPDLVAVLHERPDAAAEALTRVEARFTEPAATVDDETIFDQLVAGAPAPDVIAQGGDLAAGRAAAVQTLTCRYRDSYFSHAPMETHAALATLEGDRATVWASTQNPFGARDLIARAIGFPSERVRVITPFVGGAFGGKTVNAQAVEAARLAQAVGRPVQVMRTREEEFFYDAHRSAAVIDVVSGLDADGRIAFWDYTVIGAGDRGAAQFYDIPHHRTLGRPRGYGRGVTHPFAVGPWRAPGNPSNTFARECQMDLLAARAGRDPVEFRLRHLSDARMARVLRAAAELFGWSAATAPSRRGVGVACGTDAGTYVAGFAEVAVDARTGDVQVKRLACAQDMGIVVNPAGATIQMEGCLTMGLGYALSEEVRFAGGRVLNTNFHRYELPRFSTLPRIQTRILEANDLAPQGGGEPAIIIVGAMIANAIFDATGASVRRMPMIPARVQAAIQEARRAGA